MMKTNDFIFELGSLESRKCCNFKVLLYQLSDACEVICLFYILVFRVTRTD